MGNTPTKEARPRSSSFLNFGAGHTGTTGSRGIRRNTALSSLAVSGKSLGKAEERFRAKEKHALNLVVRYQENVDGGYLAPFGTYKLNLDFDTQVVRGLILDRRLAPFYTPLQDFDDLWTEEEIVTLVTQNPLHALDSAYVDEEEGNDLEDHKIHRSLNFHKRQEQKRRLQEMLARVKEQQKRCEEEYLEARVSNTLTRLDLPSRDLILKLYRNSVECPICFLYFPSPLNFSRCCRQPICTECFVQIKRLDPHPPHDEPGQQQENELPHTLISEPAQCPYCAMADFGVTYEPNKYVHVGLGAPLKPSDYKENTEVDTNAEADHQTGKLSGNTHQLLKPARDNDSHTPRRRSSVAAESDTVITIDDIRPGWEQRLASAKSRLARKAAAASAIHASSLIMNNEGSSSRNNAGQNQAYILSVEDRMIEEAMRLLLLEEEERLAKAQRDSEGSSNS